MYIQCILKKKKAARRGKKEKTEKLLRKTIVLYHSHKSHQTYDSLCRKYSNICIPHKGLSQREKHYPSHLGFSYFFFPKSSEIRMCCGKGISCKHSLLLPLYHKAAASVPLWVFVGLPTPKTSEIWRLSKSCQRKSDFYLRTVIH